MKSRNIKSCEYADVTSNYLNNQLEHLTLFHLYIRSLQKNIDDLHELIYSLPKLPHITSLSETKIKNNLLLNLSIPGYKFLNVNSLTNAAAGGIGVYIAAAILYDIIIFDSQFPGCELRIRITCLISKAVHIIGTIYRHFSTNAKNFTEFLNDIIS